MFCRHHWEWTVTNFLILKVKHDLFSGLYGQKNKPQNPGPCILCHLHFNSGKRYVVQIVIALYPCLIPGRSILCSLNLCPVVWTKNDIASRLFTIRDAQSVYAKDLLQHIQKSSLKQGSWKAETIQSWNLKQRYGPFSRSFKGAKDYLNRYRKSVAERGTYVHSMMQLMDYRKTHLLLRLF